MNDLARLSFKYSMNTAFGPVLEINNRMFPEVNTKKQQYNKARGTTITYHSK
jgi:hypothetical protein